MNFRLLIEGVPHDVAVEPAGAGVRVTVEGETFTVETERVTAGLRVRCDGRDHAFARRGRLVTLDGAALDVVAQGLAKGVHAPAAAAGGALRPPMPGRVREVLVKVGDTVRAGEPLVVLEAMKMQNEIPAPGAGRVAEVRVTVGQAVETKDVLVVLEPNEP